MPKPSSQFPTDSELEILKILWKVAPQTVSEIRETLAKSGRDLAHTTVITTLGTVVSKKQIQKLEPESGLIETECRRMGMRLEPLVGTCDRVLVPMVVGILRPAILLPATFITGWSTDQMAAILQHELSHVHRLDPLVNLLQRVVESVLFFHPVT